MRRVEHRFQCDELARELAEVVGDGVEHDEERRDGYRELARLVALGRLRRGDRYVHGVTA